MSTTCDHGQLQQPDQESRCASSNHAPIWKRCQESTAAATVLSAQRVCGCITADHAGQHVTTQSSLRTVTAGFIMLCLIFVTACTTAPIFRIGNWMAHVCSLLHVLFNHWSGTLFDLAGLPK